MIRFSCPNCRTPFQVDDKLGGKQTKCLKCGAAIAVPAAPSRAVLPATPPPESKQSPPWVLIGVSGVALVAIAVAVTLALSGRRSAPEGQTQGNHPTAQVAAVAPSEASKTVAVTPAPPAVASAAAVAPAPAPTTPPIAAAVPAPVATQPAAPPIPATPPAATPAPAPAPAAPPPMAASTVGQGTILDVLRQIDTQRDAVRGKWMFQGTSLASPMREPAVLRFPVTPPAEYRLTVVVERMHSPHMMPPMSMHSRMVGLPESTQRPEDEDGLNIGLVVDGHPVVLVVDGWQGTLSGLSMIAGRSADQNETVYRGALFRTLQATTIICTVGPGSIDVTADGRTIVHWTGQSDLLSAGTRYGAEIGNNMGLITLGTMFRVQRVELVSLRGDIPGYEPPVAAAPPENPGTLSGSVVIPASGTRSTSPRVGTRPPMSSRMSTPPGYTTMPLGATRSSLAENGAVSGAGSQLPSSVKPPSAESLQCVALVEHPLGSGSGFAVADDLVVTNAHVVEGVFPDEIKVQFGAENSTSHPISRVLYFDRARDLSILEVKSGLKGLELRSDYTLHPGDVVTLMGNPSARGGILMRNAVNSGTLTNVVKIKDQSYYQIHATVNPGWSGGPVVDSDGKVIAIVAMKADDAAVAQLRQAMSKLDQEFRSRIGRTYYDVGLTYGIPVSALAAVLQDPSLRDADRQAEANDRCAAKALADRLSFLAELSMIRLQINISPQIRTEARNLAYDKKSAAARRLPPSEQVPLMSEFEASRLDMALKSDSVKAMEERFRDRLDERLSAIQTSAHLPDPLKRDVKLLAAKVRECGHYAEHPSGGYQAFCTKVKGFSREIKEYLKRIADGLKEKET